MKTLKKLSALLACFALGGSVYAQTGPAITVIKIGQTSGGSESWEYYGQSGGLAAYSMGTTSCNPGDVPVLWTNGNHPVIGQNFFRLKDGRFEQLGQSWLKHGFCAVNESGCGSCQSTNCDSLGIGCADTYWASLNDGAGGGPKYSVNPTTGVHIDPTPNPTGPTQIRGRLQVATVDMDPAMNVGAKYFAEAQYISEHVAGAGNAGLANGWRRLTVNSVSSITGNGPTVERECAPYAWQAEDPQVVVTDFQNTDEGGPGMHGHYTLGYRVTDLGGGMWRYNYVVYNRTSDRSAGSFAVPLGSGVGISNVYFNDVDYHSGEPFNGNAWTATNLGNQFIWETDQTYTQNPDANAIRWGNMWSFGFDANVGPQASVAEVGMFKPGVGGDVLLVPADAPGDSVGTAYCFGDGSGTACPCSNNNDGSVPGSGCAHGVSAAGARLSGSGIASVTGDSLVLSTTGLEPNNTGLYFQADNQINGGNGSVFGDGLRCAGGGLIRLEIRFADAMGESSTSVAIGTVGAVSAGDVKRYQCWFRTTQNPPCGLGVNDFNLSNGYEIVWQL